jgi:hypothetical protein
MANQDPQSGVCVTCSQPATTHCAGCADTDSNGTLTLTLYCSRSCQSKDWSSHKKACQAAQGRKKLFRAAELIQETFYAVRAESFDLNITKVERDQDGKLHIFERPSKGFANVKHAAAWAEGDIDTKRAVLSSRAGGEAFSTVLYQLGVQGFKGKCPMCKPCVFELSNNLTSPIGYVAKIEELDVRVFDSRLLLRHHLDHSATAASQNIHHAVCVTLRDESVWVVDPAGAQHGQHKAVLPFSEYDRDFVAKVLDRRPYGTNERCPEKSVKERHSQSDFLDISLALIGVLSYVVDELAEWEFHHVPIKTMLKSSDKEYQRLKSMLLDHLTTAACDAVKFHDGEQKSPGQPIIVRDTTLGDIPEAEKQRIERKRERRLAAMNPSEREHLKKEQAAGRYVLML